MKKKYIVVLLLGVFAFSCDDFLNQEPENKVTNLNYWKNEKDVEAAVYNMHAMMRSVLGGVSTIVYRDRGWHFDYFSSWYKAIAENQLWYAWDKTNTCIDWENEYRVIASANLVIDNIDRAALAQNRHDFYLGQAYCVRALVYFYILRAWGDAPLVTFSEDIGEKERTPWLEIADFVRADLKKAIELLPLASQLKEADESRIMSKQIPSRGTAYAILAHLEAWVAALNHQPELNYDAIKAADEVINSGEYQLVNNPAEVCEKVLLGNSEEGILELDYRSNPDDFKISYIACLCQSWPVVPMSNPILRRSITLSNEAAMQLFPDKNDMRRSEYFYKLDSMATMPFVITTGAAYIWKWRHVVTYVGGNNDGEFKGYEDNEILIRLADIILLRAELKEKIGDIAGAVEDLNTVRKRAGAMEYTASEGSLKEAIALEREKELFLEGLQLRYFDIVRNGTFREKLLGDFKTLTDQDVSEGALYLPVNSNAFSKNSKMTQTPYWKRNGYAY